MQNPYLLTDKIALITGGGEGIGFGTAQQFINLGAKVIITGRTLDKLKVAKRELGGNCFIYQNDVTDKSSHQILINTIEKEVGELDVLVNNAGKHIKKPALEFSDEEFQSIIDINLNSVFALTRVVTEKMVQRKRGSVIFISSMAALYGLKNVIAYSSSKTALLGMTRTFATEYSDTGVRFNAIAPGFIETKMSAKAMKGDPERKERILKRTPAGRFGKPEEVGLAVAFLASDASQFITGVCLPVDGGNSIGF